VWSWLIAVITLSVDLVAFVASYFPRASSRTATSQSRSAKCARASTSVSSNVVGASCGGQPARELLGKRMQGGDAAREPAASSIATPSTRTRSR
jgi:hypothetical protein